MDRLKKLFKGFIDELEAESLEKLADVPEWKLDNYLISSSTETKTKKIQLIQEKFLSNDKVYMILTQDLNNLKNEINNTKKLQILSIDDKLLESQGYSEANKERVYSFILEVRNII
jgi:hypothetical protein